MKSTRSPSISSIFLPLLAILAWGNLSLAESFETRIGQIGRLDSNDAALLNEL